MHDKQSEAEPAAKFAYTPIVFAAPAVRGGSDSKPDFVTSAGAVDALQHEFEIECELQLADDHDRRAIRTEGDEIAAADLALYLKAEPLKEAFDRR